MGRRLSGQKWLNSMGGRLRGIAGNLPVFAVEGPVAMPDDPDEGRGGEDPGDPVESD